MMKIMGVNMGIHEWGLNRGWDEAHWVEDQGIDRVTIASFDRWSDEREAREGEMAKLVDRQKASDSDRHAREIPNSSEQHQRHRPIRQQTRQEWQRELGFLHREDCGGDWQQGRARIQNQNPMMTTPFEKT